MFKVVFFPANHKNWNVGDIREFRTLEAATEYAEYEIARTDRMPRQYKIN